MDVLNLAKKIMKQAGCDKAFAAYKLELYNIAEKGYLSLWSRKNH